MMTTHLFIFFVIMPVLLGVWMDLANGIASIQMIPQYPVLQGSVTLSVTGITGNIESFMWYRGINLSSGYHILSYFPGDKDPVITGPLYNSRMSPYPNGSLQISNLITTDEGNYTVKTQKEKPEDTRVYLKIYGRVGKPTITTSAPQPKENGTIQLACNSSNAERLVWRRVSPATNLPSGTTLSPDNRTITFSGLKRSDSGNYECEAFNPVSVERSGPISISVAYGPEDVRIQVRSLSDSFISLECSTDSVPSPNYQWRLNGKLINTMQNPLQVDKKKSENEGIYTCVVNNTITLLSATHSIYVNLDSSTCFCESGLSIGEVAAIVIGTIFGLFILELIVYFVLKANRKTPGSAVYENAHVPERTYENTLPDIKLEKKTSQESNYEQLTHKSKSIYSTMEPANGKY